MNPLALHRWQRPTAPDLWVEDVTWRMRERATPAQALIGAPVCRVLVPQALGSAHKAYRPLTVAKGKRIDMHV